MSELKRIDPWPGIVKRGNELIDAMKGIENPKAFIEAAKNVIKVRRYLDKVSPINYMSIVCELKKSALRLAETFDKAKGGKKK